MTQRYNLFPKLSNNPFFCFSANTKQQVNNKHNSLRFSLSGLIPPSLQRLDVTRVVGHQVAGTGILADLFTVLLVVAWCGIAPRHDDPIL